MKCVGHFADMVQGISEEGKKKIHLSFHKLVPVVVGKSAAETQVKHESEILAWMRLK